MTRPIGIIIKKLTSKTVQEFVNFATRRTGKQVLNKYRFIPSIDKK
jgi:ABC-type phosphate transport system substrate-binding protein